MSAEQTAEKPLSPAAGRRFSRLGLRDALAGLIPNFPQTPSDGPGLNVGPKVGRRGFLGISAAVMANPGLGLDIAKSLTEGSAPNAEVKKPVLPNAEGVLVANLRRYVDSSKIGEFGDSFETNQELIDRLVGKRKEFGDAFGTDFAWNGIELDGLSILGAGFRISRAGQLERFEVVSLANLKQSRFEGELVDVHTSGFSKKGLPGYRLLEALGEYVRFPIEAFKVEETKRYGNDIKGIRVSGVSLSNNLYVADFDADGLLKFYIENPKVQHTGPIA